MKWARFKGFDSSMGMGCTGFWVGRNLVKREKRDWDVCAGFFKMGFPGIGMVTAEEDGEHDEAI